MNDEQRVETMVKQGHQIVREAIETYKPIATLAAFSGGNDSIVSTHFGCSEHCALAMHCNTGIGVHKTNEHVHAVCARLEWPLREMKAEPEGRPKPFPAEQWIDGETAYEEYVLNHGFAGPPQHGRMYQRLKERPLHRLLAELKRGQSRRANVLVISGIRHDEIAVRAGYKRAVQKKGGLVWVNPFYWQSAADFEAYRQEFGLPRNPVKDVIGISGECLCGAFAIEGEKELVRKVEPETAAYLDQLEARVRDRGFAWGWGQRPPQWWLDQRQGQGFLFPMVDEPLFEPRCVGCARKSAKRTATATRTKR